MSSKTHNPPFVRFVRQVSNGQSQPKSGFVSMMVDNERRLRSAEWVKTPVLTAVTTTNAVTATDGVWDADAGDWSTPPTYTKYLDGRYDAFLQAGDGVVSTATMCGYAGIAAYRFKLPSAWTATTVEKVDIPVSVDKYLRAGVRVSLVFSADEAPSNDWDVIRGVSDICWKTASEPSEQEGVASFGYLGKTASPYLTASVVGDGTLSVHVADIPSLDGGAKPPYMWLYLTPEDFASRWTMYSKKATRNYGIEGSAVIVGDSVAVTFAAEVEADAAESGISVFHGGVGPYAPKGAVVSFGCVVRPDANLLVEDDGVQLPSRAVPTAADKAAAVCRLYERLFGGSLDVHVSDEPFAQTGASFNVIRRIEPHVSAESDRPVETEVFRIEAAALVIPFVFPSDVKATKVTLKFPSFFGSGVTSGARFNVFLTREYLTSIPIDKFKLPGMHDGSKPPYAMIGTITGGESAAFPVSQGDSRFGSLVVTGFFPPELVSVNGPSAQGTGPSPFLPDVSLS